MILHQVESLAAAGVTDIVLAVNYRPDVMVSALKKVRALWTRSGGLPRNTGLSKYTVRGGIQHQNRIFCRVGTSRYRGPSQACRKDSRQRRHSFLRAKFRRHLRLSLPATGGIS